MAADRITARIAEEFAGHGLATLVTAILVAEGFHCAQAPPGPDGGVDIRAGRGPLGLSSPARDELRNQQLRVRVWEAADIVDAVLRTYDRLPEEIRTQLPLKRVWILSDVGM